MDLAELLGSWELHLRAERKSAQTVKSDGNGVRAHLAWCERAGRPAVVDRHQLRELDAALLAVGAKPSTAGSRHLAVRRFSAWLTEEGEQASDPLLGMRAPQLDKPVVEPLTDDQLRAMLEACRGADLRDRRDEAVMGGRLRGPVIGQLAGHGPSPCRRSTSGAPADGARCTSR